MRKFGWLYLAGAVAVAAGGCYQSSTPTTTTPTPTPVAGASTVPTQYVYVPVYDPYMDPFYNPYYAPYAMSYDPYFDTYMVMDAPTTVMYQADDASVVRVRRIDSSGKVVETVTLAAGDRQTLRERIPTMTVGPERSLYYLEVASAATTLKRWQAGKSTAVAGYPALPAGQPKLADLAADGPTVTTALKMPPQPGTTADTIFYTRAAENTPAEATFSLSDPLQPTTRMAAAPDGRLLLVGPDAAGQTKAVIVRQDQQVTTLPLSLDAMPDAVGFSGTTALLAFNGRGEAARLTTYDLATAALGESTMKLADGYVETVNALGGRNNTILVLGKMVKGDQPGRVGLVRLSR